MKVAREPSKHPANGARSVCDLIERQIQSAPGRVALQCDSRQVTYGELGEQSKTLADKLRREGIGRDQVVGIAAVPGCQTLINILGVLRAGGAYLPLDPAHPQPRREAMLDEADGSLTLEADGSFAATASLKIHPSRGLRSDTGSTRLPDGPAGDDLAYIIYTSGSTGRPNGVLVSHANLLSSTVSRLAYYQEPVRRFLLLSPLTFDSSVAGIFWTLTTGGTLVFPAGGMPRQLSDLARTISSAEISHLLCIPSLWRSLLESQPATDMLSPLDTVVVAGEACTADLVEQHQTRCPQVKLFNEYGPTEATVWSTVYRIGEDCPSEVPIGLPIENTLAYILDEQLQPVAPGESGELCVAGGGVTQGYLKRPAETAQRFIRNPFTNGRFARLYRTGDLVRRNDDGNLIFQGRIDDQIKIRGHRIDPGEVESVLRRHPAVQDAAVFMSRGSLHGCYQSPRSSANLATSLRGHLKAHLPAYMVPARLQRLEALPRTAHGKVDRRALERGQYESDYPPVGAEFQVLSQARNRSELDLMHCWREVLGHHDFDQHSDFFQVGGDSLNAMALMARIRAGFSRELTLPQLLANPTVARLAAVLEEAGDSTNWSPLVRLQPNGSRRPLFMIHPGGGNVLCYLELAKHLGDDQPLVGLQAPGVDGVRDPVGSVEELADEYLAAIKSIQPEGPYALGGWSFGGLVAFEIARRLQDTEEFASTLALVDSGILYAVHVMRHLFNDHSVSLLQLLNTGEQELLPMVREAAIRAGIFPPGASHEQMLRILKVFRANAAASLDYRPRHYAGELLLIRGCDKPSKRPEHEWQPYCDRMIVEHVSGEHLNLCRPPYVAELASVLQRHLPDRQDGGRSGVRSTQWHPQRIDK